MACASACGTAVPLLLGSFVDHVERAAADPGGHASFSRVGARYLVFIGCAFVLREALGVGRRYVVEFTCARMQRLLTRELVGHLLRVDLATLTRYKVGALDSRMSRSVEGVEGHATRGNTKPTRRISRQSRTGTGRLRRWRPAAVVAPRDHAAACGWGEPRRSKDLLRAKGQVRQRSRT